MTRKIIRIIFPAIAGFLLAIIFDLFIRKLSNKKLTGYFAIVVLVAAFIASWMQWIPYQPGSSSWKGGSMIFPYSSTFFPTIGMAVVDNFAVFLSCSFRSLRFSSFLCPYFQKKWRIEADETENIFR